MAFSTIDSLSAFFPQLIAGPIVHHRHVIPQLSGSRFLRFHGTDLTVGFALFAIGLSKKVLIADKLRLPKNFESPFKAGSIIEFWRR